MNVLYDSNYGTAIHGDSLEWLRAQPDNSVDCFLTDPPYGMRFMGKKWDYDIPPVEVWKECLRVLKPGGHLFSFAGRKSQHRMACRIEDAGFDLNDTLFWFFGEGFAAPFSVSKAIDKKLGKLGGIGELKIRLGDKKPYPINANPDAPVKTMTAYQDRGNYYLPTSSEAQLFKGHYNRLCPAYEPILWASKPREGGYAENALRWGIAGINIDDCRIETEAETRRAKGGIQEGDFVGGGRPDYNAFEHREKTGRYPSGIAFDEEAARQLDLQVGVTETGGGISKSKGFSGEIYGKYGPKETFFPPNSGGPSRFFYVSKSTYEKHEGCEGLEGKTENSGRKCVTDNAYRRGKTKRKNSHPTVKPIKIMSHLIQFQTWLVKLMAPPRELNPVIVDIYGGTFTTALACYYADVRFIVIEKELESCEIGLARLKHAMRQGKFDFGKPVKETVEETEVQRRLFDEI